jgi:hypothetical protein
MADAQRLSGRSAKRISSFSCTGWRDDDDDNSRGRSANRASYFSCTSCASSSDYIDHTTSPLPPALVLTAKRSTLLDVFRSTKRTDPFRPLSPPDLTHKEEAQLQLRTARLILLRQLGHQHPLMARVKLNGTLKPASTRFYDEVYSVEDTFPKPNPRPSKVTRGSKLRWGATISTEDSISGSSRHAEAVEAYKKRTTAHHERLQERAAMWVGEKRGNTQAAKACQENAKRMEMERREELKEEIKKWSGDLEKMVSALGHPFDGADCSVMEDDELEDKMLFQMDMDMAA